MKHALRAFALICVVVTVVATVIVFGDLYETDNDRPPHANAASYAAIDLDGLGEVVALHDYYEDIQVAAFLTGYHEAELAARPRAARGGGGSCDRPAFERPAEDDHLYAIPIEIVERESGGNYGACNESSGACGAYQALPSTWDGFGGYASACDAPPAVQDEWARQAREARGCAPWAASC